MDLESFLAREWLHRNYILFWDVVFYDNNRLRSIEKIMMEEQRNAQSIILRELLTNIRATAQLTQAQLSQRLNRPQSYVSKYEAGDRKLTLIEIREIVICCSSNLNQFVDIFEEELKLVEE